MSDIMIRAAAADEKVRAFACDTRELVEQARIYHDTWPVVTAALGRLLTAGSMMGTMMKGEKDRLTLKIKGDGEIGGLVVVADSKGEVKGMAYEPHVRETLIRPGKMNVGAAVGHGELTVIKDLGLREPYVGAVNLVSGEIAEDLTYYFAESEQVPSAVALGVLVGTDYSVRQAGGFIIQLMPDAGEDIINEIESRVQKLDSVTEMLEQGMAPADMLDAVLGNLDLQILDESTPVYHCGCSKERMERALLSLGRKDLQSLYDDGKEVEMCCQFCDGKYMFSHEEVGELLQR
ncbi:MAG: Hsp33 family molecular chaperone HslO [Catonella sp.]|nr:Hsp33 family molecular chaperone HslO [Catonella sp.]MDY6356780.1 Hsp33 family molecular chaperone HslO [Catonella sp.]